MLKFKSLIIAAFALLAFAGCVGKTCDACYGINGERSDIGGADAFYFNEVMTVQSDCSLCSGRGGTLKINGTTYKSDVAIQCCLEKNMIDTNIGLKKVYIHRITDDRQSARSIRYSRRDGSQVVFNSNPRLETLFYMFLERELQSRGILVVDTQTSPYTYRLDVSFGSLSGEYDRKAEQLNGRLEGSMRLSNINFSRLRRFSTHHHVEKLEASESKDFDFFIALLVKQAAIKVADEISKI